MDFISDQEAYWLAQQKPRRGVGPQERMMRGSGMEDRDETSRGMGTLITEDVPKIKPLLTTREIYRVSNDNKWLSIDGT